MANKAKKRRNVKSRGPASLSDVALDQFFVANQHEKGKDFLTFAEIQSLAAAASKTRSPLRNRLIIMMSFMHGLRVSEIINLSIDDIDFENARLWVNRLKGGLSTEHPIDRKLFKDIKAYRNYHRIVFQSNSIFFQNESGEPFTRQGVNYLIKRVSNIASIPNVHPHTLRHSCGFYLANKGYDLRLIQDYLGHRDPKHTAIYTRTAAKRFENLFE